ncbi:unnamed protein product [Rangifer tarandus platyrhynchus]|uniref:Uncharacterized protein n=1 Tax=Rangifer tarandus platyrhynchus TaxID=3082113 RepID=A0ABN8Y6M9_RANTA|nr:unnamed protein product [Rangifer tarandus platyrhynchus]
MRSSPCGRGVSLSVRATSRRGAPRPSVTQTGGVCACGPVRVRGAHHSAQKRLCPASHAGDVGSLASQAQPHAASQREPVWTRPSPSGAGAARRVSVPAPPLSGREPPDLPLCPELPIECPSEAHPERDCRAP